MAKVVFNDKKHDATMAEMFKHIGLNNQQEITLKAWLVVFAVDIVGDAMEIIFDGMGGDDPMAEAKAAKVKVDDLIGRKVGEL